MNRDELVNYIDVLLKINLFRDRAPNGLQVEGKTGIKKIVTGVSACQALIDAAIAMHADAILVHHGWFWQNENPVITGMKHKRLASLLEHDINLLAYHLPLDAHHSLGNNTQLAQRMGWLTNGRLDAQDDTGLVFYGELPTPQTGLQLRAELHRVLGFLPVHVASNERVIKTIAWCTGAAQGAIGQVINKGIDAYVSGEISERTTHIARENDLHYFAAGHHATERYGIIALGEHLAQTFAIEHEFVDIENPA